MANILEPQDYSFRVSGSLLRLRAWDKDDRLLVRKGYRGLARFQNPSLNPIVPLNHIDVALGIL